MQEIKSLNRYLAYVIFILLFCVAVSPILIGKEMPRFFINNSSIIISEVNPLNGSLSGYVKDSDMNPIKGARVRVSFHQTYEEDYSDEDGFYHVTNIPICYCMKNASCYKQCYNLEWLMLAIVENTTHNFILNATNHSPNKPRIKDPDINKQRSNIENIKLPEKFLPGSHNFSFMATDPDGDNIRYHIDWGDGTYEITEYYPSGFEVIISHTYEEIGVYIIKAMAEDICGFFGPTGTTDVPIISSRDCKCTNEINTGPWEDFCNAISNLAQVIQDLINEYGGIYKLLAPLFAALISIWMIFCWLYN